MKNDVRLCCWCVIGAIKCHKEKVSLLMDGWVGNDDDDDSTSTVCGKSASENTDLSETVNTFCIYKTIPKWCKIKMKIK